MSKRQGFTLIEILVVMFILGILTYVVFPNLLNTQRNGAVSRAQNNLFTIYTAQQNFYFSNGIWCHSAHPKNLRFFCDNITDINTDLGLNMIDPTFAYICNNDASGFRCTATATFSGTVITLTLKNIPIAYNGGVGIGTSNPLCASAPASIYCPPAL
jgi:prepilin-type N-terminal cleavage/methylation domain-containing protein